MDFDSQHLQFSVDLFSKAGHEAIVAHIEGELKHLEHAKEYLAKRAKVELDYASALERINTAACKAINDNDKESPIRKVSTLNLNVTSVIFMSVSSSQCAVSQNFGQNNGFRSSRTWHFHYVVVNQIVNVNFTLISLGSCEVRRERSSLHPV